jgi:cell pole-organizing protein PopZ
MGDVKHEPSMEDILASIKRIIADDSQAAVAAVARVENATGHDNVINSRTRFADYHDDTAEAEEVLELTQPIDTTEAPAASEFRAGVQPRDTVRPIETPRASEPLRSVAEASAASSPTIVSEDAASASRQSLAALSALIVKPEDGAAPNTLDALVREMLRPMLKDWLDQRLPELVEKLVEKEIGRITGRTF